MLSYRELFLLGMDYPTYLAQGSAEETNSVIKIENLLSDMLPKTILERLNRIEEDVHILVSSEVWCPDCQLNTTVLNHMSLLQPKIKYSIISKEFAEEHILLQSLELQKIKIPLIMMLDSNFKLTGLFVERPKTLSSVKLFEQNKEAYFGGKHLNDTITEILEKLGV